MKNISAIALLALLTWGCGQKSVSDQSEQADTTATQSKDPNPSEELVEVITTFDELAKRYGQDKETLYLINFWATWCRPCVAELPYIEALHEKLKDQKMEIILVSIDFPKDLEERVIPFVKDRQLKSKVVLLADDDMDSWIRKVNEQWDGAIPATIMAYQGNTNFHVGKFTEESLDEAINTLLQSANSSE